MTSAEWQLSTMEFILGWLFAVPTTIFVMERKEKLLMLLNSFMKFCIYLKKKQLKSTKKAVNAWGINDRFAITSNALINFNSTEDGQRIQDL